MTLNARLKKVVLVLSILFTLFATINLSNVYAEPEDNTDETIETSEVSSSVTTSSFISGAIVSLDEDTRAKELDQDYIKNFSNSMVTALSYDLSLVDPDTIGMHIIGIILYLIEGIGMLISLVVLILYNLASGSFWKTAIYNIFEAFNSILFDWNNTNSWFYRIVVMFGLIAVLKKLFSSMNRTLTFKTVASTTLQVVISCILIVFIAQSGRGIITNIDNMVNSSIVATFDFTKGSIEDESLPVEINTKAKIFDILQKQGFLLRHFGVVSVDQIPNSYRDTYKGKDYEIGKGSWLPAFTQEVRAQQILNNPSKDMAQQERQFFGNDQIGYSTSRVATILGNSLIFFLHRALTAFIIGICCLLLFGFNLLKEASLYLSIYGLVFQLFKSELRVASKWFMSRLTWCIMFIFVNLGFNMFLSFVLQMIDYISSVNLLFLLGFDIVILIAVWYLFTHWDTVWSKITNDLGIDRDSSVIDAGKVILNGDVGPGDVYQNRKNRIADSKLAVDDIESEDGQSGTSLQSTKTDNDVADRDDLADIEDENSEVVDEELEDDFDVESELEADDESEEFEDINGVTDKVNSTDSMDSIETVEKDVVDKDIVVEDSVDEVDADETSIKETDDELFDTEIDVDNEAKGELSDNEINADNGTEADDLSSIDQKDHGDLSDDVEAIDDEIVIDNNNEDITRDITDDSDDQQSIVVEDHELNDVNDHSEDNISKPNESDSIDDGISEHSTGDDKNDSDDQSSSKAVEDETVDDKAPGDEKMNDDTINEIDDFMIDILDDETDSNDLDSLEADNEKDIN